MWSNHLPADHFHWKGPENTLFTNTIKTKLVRGVQALLNYSVMSFSRISGLKVGSLIIEEADRIST